MPGNQLQATTETLERAASTAGAVSDGIDGHMSSLRPAVEGMRGSWEGSARVAFENAHRAWEEGVARLTVAMRALGENTTFSANTYQQADATNSAQLDKVAGMGITSALRG